MWGEGARSVGGVAYAEPAIRDIPVVSSEDWSGSTITLRIEVDDPVMQTIFEQARVMINEGGDGFISVNSREAQDIRDEL